MMIDNYDHYSLNHLTSSKTTSDQLILKNSSIQQVIDQFFQHQNIETQVVRAYTLSFSVIQTELDLQSSIEEVEEMPLVIEVNIKG